MQPFSAMQSLLLGALLIAHVQGVVFRRAEADRVEREAITQADASAYRAELAALLQLDTEDQQFWTDEWTAMEAELLQLQSIALNGSTNSSKAVAHPNKTTGTANTPAAVKLHATAAVKLGVMKNATVAVQNASPKQKARDERHHNLLKGIKMNLNPKTPMDLIPALAMLKGMYEDGKERIAKLNTREKQSKAHYGDQEAQHKAKISQIDTKFKHAFKDEKLNAEFKFNETRDENRIWTYWQHVREREHRQYHTSLKIQHGTLNKVKMMIDMYEKTINGTADKAKVRKQLIQASGGIPDVVLLEDTQKATVQFCQEALVEVHQGHAEFRNDISKDHRTLVQMY